MSSPQTVQIILSIYREYTKYSGFIIFIFGFIGNILNILMFLKLKIFRHNQCVFYLLVESFVDIIAVIFNIILQILTMLYGSDLSPYISIWCKFRAMTIQSLALFVLYTICFAAIDQYFSTSYSPYLRKLSTLNMARCFIIISLCFSFGHSIIFGIYFDSKPPVDCVALNPLIIKYYSYFFYPILGGLLPILVSGSFSILAYRNVRRITRRQFPIVRRRLDHQLTKFVFIRVTFLIICLTPVVIHRIYAFNILINPTDSLRVAIERLILAFVLSMYGLIYAVNFYIFFISSSRYRRQVKRVFLKKYWKFWKQQFCFNRNQVEPSTGRSGSDNELE